jgi:DNA polymerase elongation subunit (family B)
MDGRAIRLEVCPQDDQIFQALSWHAEDVGVDLGDDGLSDRYMIKIFGTKMDGTTISVTVKNFTPYFYVKCPETWQRKQIDKFHNYIINSLAGNPRNPMPGALDNIKVYKRKDFWGFTNKTQFPFIMLKFHSLAAMRHVQRMLSYPVTIRDISHLPFRLQMYEANIDPYIRFMHIQDIEPSGWLCVPSGSYRKTTDILPSICNIDIECNWTHVQKYESDDCAPFVIASFDIECTSHTGDFPVPIKSYRFVASQLYDLYSGALASLDEYHKKMALTSVLKYVFHIVDASDCAYHDSIYQIEPKSDYDKNAMAQKLVAHIDELCLALSGRFTTQKVSRDKIVDMVHKTLDAMNLPALKGDPIIQIGTTFHRYGDRDCTYKHIITVGECAPIPGATVESCVSESDMLMRWQELMQSTNPDILTGYNIFGFDFSYMHDRSKELGIEKRFMKLSRLADHTCVFKTNKLSSSALGDNILKFVDMEGRVLVDLMKVVQRDHKLDSYKLDNVAHHFMGMNKNDVSPQDICRLQKGDAEDRKVIADYCIQDCALCNHLMIKLEIIANNMGMSNVCLVPLSFIFMRGQGIKIFSLVLKQCKEEGYLIPVLDKDFSIPQDLFKEVMSMPLEDKPEFAKVDDAVKSYIKVSKEDTRLQGYKQYELYAGYIYAACHKLGAASMAVNLQQKLKVTRDKMEKVRVLLVDNEQQNEAANADDDSYEGAIVLEPKEGIYIDDPVSVLDYASLYPSSMISENLSHDCIVLNEKYNNLPGVEYLDISYDIYSGTGDKKEKVDVRTCRFAQLPNGEKGIIPMILMKLLKARKTTRKKMEFVYVRTKAGQELKGAYLKSDAMFVTQDGEKISLLPDDIETCNDVYNDFQKAVLDGLQNAYKVTANSLYGQIGAKTSPIYLKDIAACTTATGRKMIMMAKDFLETNYQANVVYGDTDSIFVIFPNSVLEADQTLRGKSKILPSISTAIKGSGEFKSMIKPPHDLEYEKTFWPFVLLSKKRYVGNLYEQNDQKFKQKSMGIVLKRRDNANIVKRIYGGVIDIILNKQDIKAAVQFLKDMLQELVEGKCPMEDLIITKSLRAEYKDPTRIAHKVLAERMGERDPGNKPMINDRIPFVYVQTPPPSSDKKEKVLQGERIEHPDFIKKNDLKPDYAFYITNQIMKPVLQLLSIVIEQIPGFDKPEGYYKIIAENMVGDYPDPRKLKDKMCTIKEKDVQELLFDPVLRQLDPDAKKRRANNTIFNKYYLPFVEAPVLPPSSVSPLSKTSQVDLMASMKKMRKPRATKSAQVTKPEVVPEVSDIASRAESILSTQGHDLVVTTAADLNLALQKPKRTRQVKAKAIKVKTEAQSTAEAPQVIDVVAPVKKVREKVASVRKRTASTTSL